MSTATGQRAAAEQHTASGAAGAPVVPVAIGGVGVVTAFGLGPDELWKGLREGRSAVVALEECRAAGLRSWLGAPAAWTAADSRLPRRALRGLTRAEQMLLDAVERGLDDAGIDEVDPLRTGLFFAGDKYTSDLRVMLDSLARIRAGNDGEPLDETHVGAGMRGALNPLFYVEGLQSLSLYNASRHWGVKGPATYVHGSGDAGIVVLRSAVRALERGEVDVAVVAAASHGTELTHMARLDGMGLLSDDNASGSEVCRPFDAARTGSVLGDGAVALVLQRAEHVGATLARVRGVGLGIDGTRAPRPDHHARGVTAAVGRAVRHSGRALGDVAAVVGHGSATRAGDHGEAHALGALLADQPSRVRYTSVKPGIGHLSAAAGLVNVVVAATALQHRELPALAHLRTRDQAVPTVLDLDGGPLGDGAALVVSRGVEGQAGAVVLDA